MDRVLTPLAHGYLPFTILVVSKDVILLLLLPLDLKVEWDPNFMRVYKNFEE
jgi:hypothetical protein